MKSIKKFLTEGMGEDDPLSGIPNWEKPYYQKGTFEKTIWDMHYKYQSKFKVHPYASKIVKKLEQEFPFVEEWWTPAPNMNKDCVITAKCNGETIASINLDEKENGYDRIYLWKWQDFFDKLRKYEKKIDDEKWKSVGVE